jgi:hypothetical protein
VSIQFHYKVIEVCNRRRFSKKKKKKGKRNGPLVASQNLCCIKCVNIFEAVSSNRMTIQRGVADISKDVETQLSETFSKYVYHSVNLYQLTDITLTAQMCIFSHLILKCEYSSSDEMLQRALELSGSCERGNEPSGSASGG